MPSRRSTLFGGESNETGIVIEPGHGASNRTKVFQTKVPVSKAPAVLYTFRVETSEKAITCPRCNRAMIYQGIESVGPGPSRIRNVPVYLCPMCGCKGWYDEKLSKITEIR